MTPILITSLAIYGVIATLIILRQRKAYRLLSSEHSMLDQTLASMTSEAAAYQRLHRNAFNELVDIKRQRSEASRKGNETRRRRELAAASPLRQQLRDSLEMVG